MKFFLLLIVLTSTPFFAQDNSEIKNLYKTFDSIVGIKNTDLSYGKTYTEKYRFSEDSHPYFVKNEFTKGTVTYQNQTFYDVYVKYNLVEDELIVNLPSDFENRSFVLEKLLLENFSLQNSLFINDTEYGLLELLFTSENISLYKKNTKSKRKQLNKTFLYYKFIDEHFYLLKKDTIMYPIKTKRDFSKLFPNQKKEISAFYKSNKTLKESNLDEFYKLLTTKIQNNIINKK
tara:strand:+ start:561 stop:1256 length:696 start_codon:yes stop_codon:yes gene_type:complete